MKSYEEFYDKNWKKINKTAITHFLLYIPLTVHFLLYLNFHNVTSHLTFTYTQPFRNLSTFNSYNRHYLQKANKQTTHRPKKKTNPSRNKPTKKNHIKQNQLFKHIAQIRQRTYPSLIADSIKVGGEFRIWHKVCGIRHIVVTLQQPSGPYNNVCRIRVII